MSKGNSGSSGGVGVLGLLGVAFVVLKLCGVIAWSWWWVAAPFWGPLAVVLALVAIYFGFLGVVAASGFAWVATMALLDRRRARKAADW